MHVLLLQSMRAAARDCMLNVNMFQSIVVRAGAFGAISTAEFAYSPRG